MRDHKEQLIFELEKDIQLSTWERSYLSAAELAHLIFFGREDAELIAQEIMKAKEAAQNPPF